MNAPQPMLACFVTGTDTEIGKTRISAGLLHGFARQGLRSAGLKPVAAGMDRIDGHLVNEDVRALRDAGSLPLTDAEVGPLQFEAACAPHIAAALEGRRIDRGTILDAASALAARADALVVEGVGGFCVPLGADWDTADLAAELGLPVVLVVGLRLGCISHALLTAEAIRARGLHLAGWVGNRVLREMAWAEDNIAALRHEFTRRHGAPCLGIVPWLADPSPAAVAAHLDIVSLQSTLASIPIRSSVFSS
jgi:dethiobiotin synthetase